MAQPSQPTFPDIWQLETLFYLKVTKLKMGKLDIFETSKNWANLPLYSYRPGTPAYGDVRKTKMSGQSFPRSMY